MLARTLLLSGVACILLAGCGGDPTGNGDGSDAKVISPFGDNGNGKPSDATGEGTCTGPDCSGGCVPDCGGLECGDDGCGGSCGDCPIAAPECQAGICIIPCEVNCDGRECGDDGCGGSCGLCPDAAPLCADGICAFDCTPDCQGKSCGNDGCEGSCGECEEGKDCVASNCTSPGLMFWPCTEDDDCISGICVDYLDGKVCTQPCGDECPPGWSCILLQTDGDEKVAICAPECQADCSGKECGDNGCGGECGMCPEGQGCFDGACKPGPCIPACDNKECGFDGCGGGCGDCPETAPVCKIGECVIGACTPKCGGVECGTDGCGGTCGECAPFFFECLQGLCVSTCEASCVNKECGSDGCNGICGFCTDDYHCEMGVCIPDCLPKCAGKECGDDGCGGVCGMCDVDGNCIDGQCIVPGDPADCVNVLNCLIYCDVYTECIGDCLALSSPAGQDAYDDMIMCGQQFCSEWTVGTPQNQFCVLQACSELWSVCVGGWGSNSCNGILDCVNGCQSAECQWQCIYGGNQVAQQTFWNMQVCLQGNCSYCGPDQQCWANCAQAACVGQIGACQNN